MFRKSEKGFFDEFEREFQEMNRLINSINSVMQNYSREPVVYGFSIQVGPEGVPHVEHFGTMNKEQNIREPFTSSIVDDKNNELNITAEMPGIQKEDIEVNATEDEVIIKAESNEREYYKTVKTQLPVDPDSARAKYNNGVLEVTFSLKEPPKPKGKAVKVE